MPEILDAFVLFCILMQRYDYFATNANFIAIVFGFIYSLVFASADFAMLRGWALCRQDAQSGKL